MADVTKRETVVGATGPGSRTLTHPRAFNELLGTKFKVVSGYPGGNEITLAIERGEVEGYCGWTVGSIVNRASNWLHDGTHHAAGAVHRAICPMSRSRATWCRPRPANARSISCRPTSCWPGRWSRRPICRPSA